MTAYKCNHFLFCFGTATALPLAYTLSSWDAYNKYRALNVQAGTRFCDGAFQAEVAGGKITGSSLDRFVCVALAGVAAEYVEFGQV